jgi:hypothetical protein
LAVYGIGSADLVSLMNFINLVNIIFIVLDTPETPRRARHICCRTTLITGLPSKQRVTRPLHCPGLFKTPVPSLFHVGSPSSN